MNRTQTSRPVEDFSPYYRVGLVIVLLLIVGMNYAWLKDTPRLSSASQQLYAQRIQRGEQTFMSQCSACHGQQGEGGVGPALNNRTLLKNTLDVVLYSLIRSGVPNTQMPAWSVDYGGPLTDEDIRDVVAYLRSWEANAPEVTAPVHVADASRGAVLFASTCAICHGEDGKGGKPGVPALNVPDRLQKLDDNWYRGVIANGRPAKGMPTWVRFFRLSRWMTWWL
jgi:cbb3-type cytochrome c oxidase subunit III